MFMTPNRWLESSVLTAVTSLSVVCIYACETGLYIRVNSGAILVKGTLEKAEHSYLEIRQ
jgi:hypothetical protein